MIIEQAEHFLNLYLLAVCASHQNAEIRML